MQTVLNQSLKLSLPEGFRQMDDAELKQLSHPAGAPQWAAKDPDRHMIISIAWKKNGFAALLLNAQEVAKKMESKMSSLMASYGYARQRFLEADLGGEKASGFLYTYTAQGTPMAAETLSVKKGKTFYYIHCYMRDALLTESLNALDEILASAKWEG